MVSFDKQTYRKLENKYQEAVKNNLDEFVFEKNKLLTVYAKYLIQYLKIELDMGRDNLCLSRGGLRINRK